MAMKKKITLASVYPISGLRGFFFGLCSQENDGCNGELVPPRNGEQSYAALSPVQQKNPGIGVHDPRDAYGNLACSSLSVSGSKISLRAELKLLERIDRVDKDIANLQKRSPIRSLVQADCHRLTAEIADR